jgi:hypothetical protein
MSAQLPGREPKSVALDPVASVARRAPRPFLQRLGGRFRGAQRLDRVDAEERYLSKW